MYVRLSNGKTVGLDGLPTELLTPGPLDNSTFIFELHRIIVEIWTGRDVQKDATVKTFHK